MAEPRGRYIVEFKDIPSHRQRMPELPVEERMSNFGEVELGFSQEQAISEASRCLSCRTCLGCALCLAECHTEAIDFTQADRDIELEVDSLVIAPGVEISWSIEERFGYSKYTNVITFLEFERILSDSGPYGGLVLRPYDGEIPRRIAFVLANDHYDAHCLSYAIKGALAAQRKVHDLETHLFFPNIDLHRDEANRYLGRGSRIDLRRGEVFGIGEIEDTKNPVVQFVEDGENREEEFELVVLLTAFEVSDAVRELTRKLGIYLANPRIQETADGSLVKTSKEGVFFVGLAPVSKAGRSSCHPSP